MPLPEGTQRAAALATALRASWLSVLIPLALISRVCCDPSLLVPLTEAAETAVAAGPGALAPDGWIAHEYNERPYRDRGWCSFEGSVSVELIARLGVYPKMDALLNSLPPKLLGLSAECAVEPVAWDRLDESGGRHVEHAVRCIEDATFTGKGDKPKVVALYKDYVSRTVGALARTLALASIGDTDSAADGTRVSERRRASRQPDEHWQRSL